MEHTPDASGWQRPRLSAGVIAIAVLLVVVLAVLVAGLLVPNQWGSSVLPEDVAHAQMKSLADAVQAYYLAHRALPANLESLLEMDPKIGQTYLDRLPLDPWKSAYRYRIVDAAARKFEVSSAGPDARWGTDDDLVFPPPKSSSR